MTALPNKKAFCVVTGASRGIGKCIAISIGKHLVGSGSVMVLLARSVPALEEVRKTILDFDKVDYTDDEKVKVVTQYFDQGSSDQEKLDALFPNILDEVKLKATAFEQCIIIHNAGTLEELKYCKNLDNIAKISEYFNINLTGLVALNAKFMQAFSESNKLIINITSLCGIQPCKSWGLYCTVKAGRELYFKVLATEDVNTRVLNYSPGPIKTDMMDIAQTQTEDNEVRQSFQSLEAGDKLLSCEETVDRMMMIIEKNQFQNAAHIDYYDEI